jgi:hypothetical protein
LESDGAAGKAGLLSRLETWGGGLKGARDIALVGFGGVYAFGYLARAVHAWDYNLGVLPGVELQYFVAGFVLLMPPALVLGALFGTWRLLQRYASWEEAQPRRRQRLDNVLGVLLLGGLLIFGGADLAGRFVPIHPYISNTAFAVFLGAITVTFGLAIVRPESMKTGHRAEASPGPRHLVVRVLEGVGLFLSWLFVVNFGLVVTLLLLSAMLLGAAKILPVLPQALGGVAPRCAQLDVDATALPRELVDALFKPDAVLDKAAAKQPRRSREVMVFHSGADSVLFKLPEAATAGGATYELKRASINAVLWCPTRGPARK